MLLCRAAVLRLVLAHSSLRRQRTAAKAHAALVLARSLRAPPQISEGLQVLPGVEALLVALAARANCVTGLVRLLRVRRR